MKYNPAVQALFLAALPQSGTRSHAHIQIYVASANAALLLHVCHEQWDTNNMGHRLLLIYKPPEMDKNTIMLSFIHCVCIKKQSENEIEVNFDQKKNN